MTRITEPGHHVLKAPIGTHGFVRHEIEQRIEELVPKFRAITSLNDAHASFCLLRSTMSVCQVNYLLRATPSNAAKQGAQAYDTHVFDALNELVGDRLSWDVFREF